MQGRLRFAALLVDFGGSMYWVWALIGLGTVLDFGYENVQCVNGSVVKCSGVDFANLLFGVLAGIVLIVKSADHGDEGRWGRRAALAACVGLLVTAFDGAGCRCPDVPSGVPMLLP
jgi:hypothetical protein